MCISLEDLLILDSYSIISFRVAVEDPIFPTTTPAARFANLCGQWNKQLRNAGFLKPKPQSEYTRKSLIASAKRVEKKLSKSKLLVKRPTKK